MSAAPVAGPVYRTQANVSRSAGETCRRAVRHAWSVDRLHNKADANCSKVVSR